MTLPLFLSVPHAGLLVPPEVRSFCRLTTEDIVKDGDEGAREIYYPLKEKVCGFLTTDIARAIVDQNRAAGDRRKDGVVKTHTCWDVPVYDPFPPDEVIEELLDKYHRPYHQKLARPPAGAILGVDCHTMAEFGPPVGPDPGRKRPWVCLSNADMTCPDNWIRAMAACFEDVLGDRVAINDPFQGGYIIRTHYVRKPWVQVEFSREEFCSLEGKNRVFEDVLGNWCEMIGLCRSQ